MEINGSTKVLGLIGNPVAHSLSPCIHNNFFDMKGINAKYLTFKVTNVESAVKGGFDLDIYGFNVTVPHKKEVIPYLRDIDELAEMLGAVNTLKRLENGYKGYNTDILGMMKTFEINNVSLKDKTVLILGAGGSSFAGGFMAAKGGAKRIYILNRSEDNANILKNRINKYFDTEVIVKNIKDYLTLESCDVVIQTTTLGFGDKVGLSPVSEEFFKKYNISFAFDAIYVPRQTEFLKQAENCNVKCSNGLDMLLYQALEAEKIWFDRDYTKEDYENLKSKIGDLV